MIEWFALGLGGFAASLSLLLLFWAAGVEQERRGNPWPRRKR